MYPVRPNASCTDGIPISAYLRTQAPSNPELAGALGPAPRQYVRPQPNTSDGTVNSPYPSTPNALGHEGSSSVRLAYPYPERNVVHPANYTGHTPPAANKMIYNTTVPPGFHRLPQTASVDKCVQPSSWSRIGSQHAPIKFNRKGGGNPFRVDELIELSDMMPKIEGRHDQVFKNIGERYIKVVMTWPGYGQFPVERRICTENGTLTRAKLLMILATHIEEFMHHVHRKEIPVETGYEKYELIWRPRGKPSIWRDCLITSLVHRSGSTWQVELYAKV
ncbi:uncharacterized protein EDB91DRAFT_207158 [Suillus paluster]|uniref:uncharacterized protein n=1 Tax=Suillus paluster TaxID=48578 RepID=UPI001B86A064|nr:uncharacterized protein EDB91DRAFT_207158 [Suillus paluster]KAG1744010.1 hypothetical protein EDB91DRAFT_207158 [Suillus paluster]